MVRDMKGGWSMKHNFVRIFCDENNVNVPIYSTSLGHINMVLLPMIIIYDKYSYMAQEYLS